MNSFKNIGMQVHAVPDDERAVDATGKRLPWAYSYAEYDLTPTDERISHKSDNLLYSSQPSRKLPTEKGPFGRATTSRRASTRKATTPAPGTTTDRIQSENLKYYDQIFGKFKADQEEAQPAQARIEPAQRQLLLNARGSIETLPATQSTAPQSATAAPTTSASFKEPTEVVVSGFGADHQYQALSFFEKVSQGRFYEDYDREPAEPRFASAFSQVRGTIPKTLPRDALKNINTYQGGEHWIKVTFDSPHAAQLACHASPHVIQGYSVKCEPWNGAPPLEDLPRPATHARETKTLNSARNRPARRPEHKTLPNRMPGMPAGLQLGPDDDPFLDIAQSPRNSSSSTAQDGSTTASASTATNTSRTVSNDATPPGSLSGPMSIDTALATALPTSEPMPATKSMRLRGARKIIPKTAEEALRPQEFWPSRLLTRIGSYFSSGPQGGTMIGSEAPRKDDGTFDSEKASFWWSMMYFFDRMYGLDLCGLGGDD